MNFSQFKNTFQARPLIFSKDVERSGPGRQAVRNQLNRWRAKGLIVRLKKGIYLLNKNDRRVHPGLSYIANRLYEPSYVSMEYALSFYGLIPERVADITSITTKKTARFKNVVGNFIYQHVKPPAFRGFKEIKEQSGLSYFLAEPEKAVVDFFYLNLAKFRRASGSLFDASFRFQNTGILRKKKLTEYAQLFHNNRLSGILHEFYRFMEEEKKS